MNKNMKKKWLNSVTNRTAEQRADDERRKMMVRMSRTNLRTFKGTVFIGRNDPCYCGNVYADIMVKDGKGGMVEKPVKFKDCCMLKHVGLRPGEITPALAEKQKKEQAYFAKHRRLI